MSKRILIIDDDKFVRESFMFALEDLGKYSVDAAESGEKGLDMMRNQTYDLVYLDLKMPGMNGVETLFELRKIDATVPVYIVTAFHQEFFQELNEAVEAGIQFEVLKKPIDTDKIVYVTKNILEKPHNK